MEFTCTARIGDHFRSTSINITAYCEFHQHTLLKPLFCDCVCVCLLGLTTLFHLLTAPVQFTEQPTPLASHTPSNQPLLTCTATSIPIPTITWFRIRNGTARQLTDGEEGVSVSAELGDDKCSVRSTLQLAAQITDHETMEGYYCMGDNGFFKIDSSTLDPLQCKNYKLSLSLLLFQIHTHKLSLSLSQQMFQLHLSSVSRQSQLDQCMSSGPRPQVS